MRTESFYAGRNRTNDNILHIETDGCIVNIQVGLHDAQGRPVTRVDVTPDGDDGCGNQWDGERGRGAPPYDWIPGAVPIRVVRVKGE
jgi:hypothetical protein